jgi:transglutaminase-like putative cysteine protease
VAYAYRHADLPDDIDASTFEGRLGHCYTLAAHVHANLYMRGWKDITLVHGIIGASGNPHAWLEFRLDGKRYVYDPTLDGIIPHDFYRDEWRCRVWSRYTIQQASALITAEKSFGPWGANDARYDKRVEAMERLKAEGRFPPPPDMDKVPMLRAAEPGAEPMIPFSIQG